MSAKSWIFCGALLAGLAVAAGALGAHGLESKLSPKDLATFEVAVRYQMYHALALVLIGVLLRAGSRTSTQIAGCAFLLGIVGFSGGLFAWLFTQQKWLMIVVPVGGTTFIVGWVALAISALLSPSDSG